MCRIVVAETDSAADPGVLLVGGAAVELDQHPEPTCIEVTDAEDRAERVHRSVADQRGRMRLPGPTDRSQRTMRTGRPMKSDSGRGPRSIDDVSRRRPPVDVGLDRAVEPDLVLDHRPVREGQAQLRGVRVRPGPDLDHLAGRQLVDQAIAGIDDVEAAILGDPVRAEIDLVTCLEPEAPDRRDVEACDVRHARMLPELASQPARRPRTPNQFGDVRTAPNYHSLRDLAAGLVATDDDVADCQGRLPSRTTDVERENGFDALRRRRTPAVVEVVLERLAIGLERVQVDLGDAFPEI